METVEIFISGKPVGKSRPRFSRINGFTKVYTPEETTSYERAVGLLFHQKKKDMFTGYVSIKIKAIFPIPSSTPKKSIPDYLNGKILPDKKPDLDNICKIILDGLNGVAYEDDKAVVELMSSKHYGTEPGVHVTISDFSW